MKSTTEMDLSKIDVGEIKGIRLIEPNELAEEDEVEMNKKELTKKLMNRMTDFGYFPSFTNVKVFIREYKKLTKSEPQKPVVPQYIADFIAEQKKHGLTLSYSIDASMSEGIAEWYWDNPELFARAWLDGYEVEKEKRYQVNMFGLSNKDCCLIKNLGLYKFGCETDGNSKYTRKELEDAGFGWVFSCDGVEVEEVEECKI